jgi:O-antigen/teichoic acid export membrane protein
MTWLFALTLIPMALDTAWVYKGLGATLRVGKAMILDQTLCLVLIIALVHGAAHQARVPLIQMMGDIAGAAFLGIPLMRGKWSLPGRAEVRALASRASLVTLSRILRMIVISFDIVLLGVLVSSREVGWYSAAYRIVFFVMAILYASHSAFLPEIARSAQDPRAMGAIMSKSIGLALSVTAPFIVGGFLLAPAVLRLIYGADYASGAEAFRLLLLSLVFLAVHAATRSVFISMHRMGLEAIIIATGVAVNLVMNFVLIPRNGINGAAIAAVAGELVTMVGALSALITLGVRPDVRLWISPLIASAALAAVISLVAGVTPVVLTIVIGAAVYLLTIGALTVVTRRRQSLLPAQ